MRSSAQRSLFPGFRCWPLLLSLGLVACGPEESAPALGLEQPAHFVGMDQPEANPFRAEVAELGRRLFYDPILSADSTVSCASCHQQSRAFSDGLPQSVGIGGRKGTRNAIALSNVGFRYKGLFWDGRAPSLEASVSLPLTNPREMGNDWPTALSRLNAHPRYRATFEKTFGKKRIEQKQVEWALAQFMRTLVSAESKFDRVLRGEATFTESEERGFHLFFDSASDLPDAECGHCHVDPLFTSLEYANNGIEAVEQLEDLPDAGRGAINDQPFDRGKFRIPSLRNVALTAPYMHDGRFQTLDEVVAHYASGGHRQVNTSANVRKLALTAQHRADLIAFLHTLTDSSFIRRPEFAKPLE